MEPHVSATPSVVTDFSMQIQEVLPSRSVSARTIKKLTHRDERACVKPNDALKFETWDTPFCGCWRACGSNTLFVACCPCISAAQIATRLGIWTYETSLLIFVGIVFCLAICVGLVFSDNSSDGFGGVGGNMNCSASESYAIAAGMLLLLFFMLVARMRWTTRRRFRIPGSKVLDFALSVGCSSCTLGQMSSHIKSYDPRGCHIGFKDTLPAFDVA